MTTVRAPRTDFVIRSVTGRIRISVRPAVAVAVRVPLRPAGAYNGRSRSREGVPPLSPEEHVPRRSLDEPSHLSENDRRRGRRHGIDRCGRCRPDGGPVGRRRPNAEKLGWRLGCQAWTFRLFPLDEAIDKTASLGLHYIETGLGLKLSKDRPEVTFGYGFAGRRARGVPEEAGRLRRSTEEHRRCPASKDADKSRKSFDFAKEMGIETIVAEPAEDAFDTLEKLCEEYQINLAIHDHPKPSHYWNPDTVLKVCKGRSKRIGACADTGHWVRSGLNPSSASRSSKAG